MSRLARSCSIKSTISGLLAVSLSMSASASLVRFCVLWLGILNVSDKGVGGGVGNKHSFTFQRPVNLGGRNFIFFCHRVRQHGHMPSVKKREKPIIDRAQSGSQLINAVTQQIRFGSAQLVTHFRKPTNAHRALGVSL